MKITISTEDHCTETEVLVKCNQTSDDIEKLLAAIRLLDAKLTVRKTVGNTLLKPRILCILKAQTKEHLYTR